MYSHRRALSEGSNMSTMATRNRRSSTGAGKSPAGTGKRGGGGGGGTHSRNSSKGGGTPGPGALPRQHSRTFSNMSDIAFSLVSESGWFLRTQTSFWTLYLASILGSWLVLCTFTDAGMALTWLNLLHAAATFPLLHWFRTQKFDKQNIYDDGGEPLTYWEQIDNGKRWTNTRKGLLITPVVLYLAASNSVDFSRQPLLLNLLAMLGLLIPKLKDQ